MNEQEKGMIEGLFQRLQQAESQLGKRDAEAEALINSLMTRQHAAPYLLSQAVLVQEQGLKNLQAQVEDLERQLAERPQGGGGFLGGLFGGGSQPAAPTQPRQATTGGWSNSPAGAQGLTRGGVTPFQQQPGAQGGGFMAGALQTAMGVAGGVLLGNAIGSLFSSPAEAAIPEVATHKAPPAPEATDTPADEGGGGFFDNFFSGGDEGGGDDDDSGFDW
ncbi:MAG: DUF2076 domain-containing protein [Chromatiaceae bacterium]